MNPCLIDTGPLVALLDSSEPAHRRTQESARQLRVRFITTGAVITEAFHFMGRLRDGPISLASFIESSALEVHDIFQQEPLEAAVALMIRYEDTPMDFADATLVVLAERMDCPDILTLDERGFRTFRLAVTVVFTSSSRINLTAFCGFTDREYPESFRGWFWRLAKTNFFSSTDLRRFPQIKDGGAQRISFCVNLCCKGRVATARLSNLWT